MCNLVKYTENIDYHSWSGVEGVVVEMSNKGAGQQVLVPIVIFEDLLLSTII